MTKFNENIINKSLEEFCKDNNTTIGELEDRKILIVRDLDTLNVVLTGRNGILKIKTNRMLQCLVGVNNNGQYQSSFSVTNISQSPIVRLDKPTKDGVVLYSNTTALYSDNFTDGYISVNCNRKNTEQTRVLLNSLVYVVYGEKTNIHAFIKKTKNSDKFISLNHNGECTSNYIKELALKEKAKVRIYYPLLTTPAGDKAFTITYKLITPEFKGVNDLERLYDKTLCGGYSLVIKELNDMQDEGKARDIIRMTALKAMTRFSAKQAPSTSIGLVRGVAVYQGKFTNKTPEKFLNNTAYKKQKAMQMALLKDEITMERFEAGREKLAKLIEERLPSYLSCTQDGQGYGDALKISNAIYREFGIVIPPVFLYGMLVQTRIISSKISMMIVSHDDFVFMLNQVRKTGAVKVYGEENEVLLLTDKNGMKLNFKEEMFKDVSLEILAHAKNSQAYTSKQMLRVIIYAAYKKYGDAGIKAVIKLFEYYGGKDLQSIINNTYENAIDEEGEIIDQENKITLSMLLNSLQTGYFTNLYLKMNKNLMTESKTFFKAATKAMLHGLVSRIDRCRFALNGDNRRMVSDPTFLFTAGKLSGILGIKDAFVQNPKIKEMVFFKYPLQGNEEYYLFNNTRLVTIKKMLKVKISEGIITEEEAKHIYSFYSYVSNKVIVLPAFSHITFTCAGSDFDYDGGCVIYKTSSYDTQQDVLTNAMITILQESHEYLGVHIGEYDAQEINK